MQAKSVSLKWNPLALCTLDASKRLEAATTRPRENKAGGTLGEKLALMGNRIEIGCGLGLG
jgi:hypothetical protein